MANDLHKRLASHLRDSRRRNTPLYSWLRKCLSRGFVPKISLIESCEAQVWPDRDRFWIEHYRCRHKLLNLADGGDEPFCPPEVRRNNGRKIAELRAKDPVKFKLYELKRNMGMALSRGYVKESTKEKLREAVRLRPDLFSCFARFL